MISGAEKSTADCTRRSPDSAPLDAGSIPAISTHPMWARPRRFRAAGPLSVGNLLNVQEQEPSAAKPGELGDAPAPYGRDAVVMALGVVG